MAKSEQFTSAIGLLGPLAAGGDAPRVRVRVGVGAGEGAMWPLPQLIQLVAMMRCAAASGT